MNKLFHPQLSKQVIIGTKSKSRRALFKNINLKFKYRAANIDEKNVQNLKNDKYDALKIATAKANYLSSRNKGKIIITFDTTILFSKKTIYKCSTEMGCSKLLNSFSNKSHNLYTGMIFMIDNRIIKKKLTATKIRFRNNDKSFVSKYVKNNFNQIKSAVGCYNIENTGKILFQNISTSYFNVLGIDIISFIKILRKI
jgi:septum formation protein